MMFLQGPKVLEQSSEAYLFQHSMKAAPYAMLIVDSEKKIRAADQQAEALFGYSSTELAGQAIETPIPVRHRTNQTPLLSLPFTGELFGRRKDGTDVPIEIGLNAIETPRGQFILVSMIDVTEQRRYEEELRRSQREAIEDKQRAEDRANLLRRVWDEIVSLAIRCELPGAHAARAQMMDAYQDPSHVEGSLAAILTTFENAFRGTSMRTASSPPKIRRLQQPRLSPRPPIASWKHSVTPSPMTFARRSEAWMDSVKFWMKSMRKSWMTQAAII